MFEPSELPSAKLGVTIGEGLLGRWAAAGQSGWSASLTGAVNYAIRSRLPGLSYFAQCLSFWVPEGESPVGKAVTWFVEPVTVGRTVMPILGQLLGDGRERRQLLGSIRWFLERLDAVEDKSRFIRRFSRLGYVGEERIDDAAAARGLVERVHGSASGRGGAAQERV